MKKKNCIGCGIELQTEFPNKDGYVDSKIIEERGNKSYCQRCFKLKNYGKNVVADFTKEDYQKEVSQIINSVDVVLAVLDIIDFEGSFNDTILDVLRDKNSIVVVNKLDLIPDDKHPTEVANWVKRRLAEEDIVPLDIAIISTKNGYGINGIYKKINHFYPNGVEIAVLGVTNVGKSSIINKLVGKDTVTVSKYPGTTLKNNKHLIPGTNITLVDTPGLIPEGRISDLVCGECNLKIIPSGEISRKTFKLDNDRVIFIGNLLSFVVKNVADVKPIVTVFASKSVEYLETNQEKQKEYQTTERFDIFSVPCKECIESYRKNKMKKTKIVAEEGQEIVFKGLGWVTVKRGTFTIEVTAPEKLEIIVREAFIKPKR